MFHALREVPDVILVAAGTVRAEGYQPLGASPEARARRAQHGRAPLPRLASVTRRLELDLDDPLFTAPEQAPIVITGASSPSERRAEVAERAEVLVAGDQQVDLGEALGLLRRGGAEVVLCEGGPSLLGQVVAADLVDELNLTFAPSLVGGDAPRITHGDAPQQLHPMDLDAVCEQDGMLLLRYLRNR
jgi:riboflavin biosynthesis pyrimidine reductase